MNSTIRELVILDILARLAVITTANDYAIGMGAHVIRARKSIDPSELPAVVLWPGTETAVPTYRESVCTMVVRVEGIAVFGSTNPSVMAEKILGDLKKCLLAQDDRSGSPWTGWNRSPDYIDSIVYTAGGTDEYPDEGNLTVGAAVTFNVQYTTKSDDPTAQ